MLRDGRIVLVRFNRRNKSSSKNARVSTSVTVAPYYSVPPSADWTSLVTTLYGDGTFATALQQAMGRRGRR